MKTAPSNKIRHAKEEKGGNNDAMEFAAETVCLRSVVGNGENRGHVFTFHY